MSREGTRIGAKEGPRERLLQGCHVVREFRCEDDRSKEHLLVLQGVTDTAIDASGCYKVDIRECSRRRTLALSASSIFETWWARAGLAWIRTELYEK